MDELNSKIDEFSALIKRGFGFIYESEIEKYWNKYFKDDIIEKDCIVVIDALRDFGLICYDGD